jgi:CRISPR-associated protein Cmr1
MEILLKTLTPVWTGGVDQICDRLYETGLIGSLRWWYEALVRGLGGYACDPTSEERCPDKNGQHCVVCELFGCTGWGRKFRLRVVTTDRKIVQDALEKNTEFVLEFVELREIKDEEKWLLAKAVEIAARYGALGGKTTLKPQKNRRGPNDTLKRFPRAKPGDEMGIVEWQRGKGIPLLQIATARSFLQDGEWRRVKQDQFPNLRCFFFINGSFLWRRQMNSLMGRSEDGRRIVNDGKVEDWLRGDIGNSKKIFSFRTADGRIWGYAQNEQMRDEIVNRIRQELGAGNAGGYVVKTGEEVLHEL